jgi:type II secretory pathway pseudopilin PulG
MVPHRPRYDGRGFTLVEVLVSLAILITGLVVLAQLLAAALHGTAAARSDTYATVLAAQKMEELAAEPGLAWSPPDSLSRNVAGFVDYVDRNGRTVDPAASAPRGFVFVRRWSVQALSGTSSVIIQVSAFAASGGTRAQASADPRPGRACLSTIRIGGAP